MRVLSALVVCALSACIQNPDPREPSLEFMQRNGLGGWIEVTLREGGVLRGELLAIDGNTIWVETLSHQTASVALYKIEKAELFTYESDWGFGLWGALGTLSTATHGFFLVFSVPIWILSSSIAAGDESRHVRLRLPEDSVDELAKWARFPQGMPKQVPAKPQTSPQDEAWQLTKQAAQAARDGNCDLVVELDARVRALDPGLHDVTFMRDEGIRRCFGLPSLLAPPPPTP